ncbi:hypothetical protein VTL71DRAFT_9439 [Oculimacula yallundae]|uniref:Uncharacterized protein n=1 Tax=Oculimacula yallundae TaxID=86028 RepID=A0ABR4BTN4_9HELO
MLSLLPRTLGRVGEQEFTTVQYKDIHSISTLQLELARSQSNVSKQAVFSTKPKPQTESARLNAVDLEPSEFLSMMPSIDDKALSSIMRFDNEKDPIKYGYRGLNVLATNNLDCLYSRYHSDYPSEKGIRAMRNPRFGKVYNERILPDILAILDPATSTSSFCSDFKELHALHMFWEDQQPLEAFSVVLLVFDRSLGTVGPSQAQDLVLRISECIERHWPVSTNALLLSKSQVLSVDVSTILIKFVCVPNVLSAAGDTRAGVKRADPWKLNPDVYSNKTPCPGASIGNSKNPDSSSTMSFYITYQHKTYTEPRSCHVITVTRMPRQKVEMVIPSNNDFDTSLYLLRCELAVKEFHEKRHKWKDMKLALSGPDLITLPESTTSVEIASIKEKIRLVEGFDRKLGSVVATSGQLKPTTKNAFCTDWSLIECDLHNSYSNKVRYPPLSLVDEDKLADKEGYARWADEVTEKLSAGFEMAAEFSSAEMVSTTRFIKPPGARTATRIACFSDTVSTLHNGRFGITQEGAFSGLPTTSPLTVPGDSGSCILSANGCVVAVIWGGDEFPSAVDLAYGTPVAGLLEDIKEKMGWEDIALLPAAAALS